VQLSKAGVVLGGRGSTGRAENAGIAALQAADCADSSEEQGGDGYNGESDERTPTFAESKQEDIKSKTQESDENDE
jgi:hypothetical protein